MALEDLHFPGLEMAAIAYLEVEVALAKIMEDLDRTIMEDSGRITTEALDRTMEALARITEVSARITEALGKTTVEWDLIGETALV